MVQTLHNRLGQVEPSAYEVMYVDEAHHSAAESWESVIEHFRPRDLVGLTATPERTDGRDITELFGGRYTTELRLWEAVDDQLLAPFEYVGVDDGTDLRGIAWHSGDYAVGALSDLYTGNHERVRRILPGNHSVDRIPAVDAGPWASAYRWPTRNSWRLSSPSLVLPLTTCGGRSRPELTETAYWPSSAAGQLQVVFSVDVLGEGIDVPDVDTLLLCRPTQSSVLFAQQLGRGLRLAPGKVSCVVLDFIGQHRAEYRIEQRYQALIDPAQGDVRAQAEGGFPFLPAGCSINLERVARERVLAALKAVAVPRGLYWAAQGLRGRDVVVTRVLPAPDRSTIEQFYGVDNRKMSWTRLQRAALSRRTGEPPRRRSVSEEADLLRRIGYLQHVSDGLRVNRWFDWMTADSPVEADELSVVEQRLAMQLMHTLLLKPGALQEGFDILWRQPAVRAEIAELLTYLRSDLAVAPVPCSDFADVPLMAHARYTRAEVFAALGVSTADKPKEHREGVYFVPQSRTPTHVRHPSQGPPEVLLDDPVPGPRLDSRPLPLGDAEQLAADVAGHAALHWEWV